MNLTELQNYVWRQTDTDDGDLPASTIADYIDEAFNRTIAAENRWPFYEQSWELTCLAGDHFVTLPIECVIPAVMSVKMQADSDKLDMINQEEAENRFEDGQGRWEYCSAWARRLYFWPSSPADADTVVVVRGYRHPQQTFNLTTGEVDADGRLHRPLAHYAVALAYAQQEDETLETVYMERWQRDVEMARKAIMDPAGNRPLVMYGNWPRTPVGGFGARTGPGFSGVVINTP